jgi:hypothetical protein
MLSRLGVALMRGLARLPLTWLRALGALLLALGVWRLEIAPARLLSGLGQLLQAQGLRIVPLLVCDHGRGATPAVSRRGVGTGRKQCLDRLAVPSSSCEVQRCLEPLVGHVSITCSIHELDKSPKRAGCCCMVQRRHAVR